MNSRPARARQGLPELAELGRAGQPELAELGRAGQPELAELGAPPRRAQKSDFRRMAGGLGHGGAGTPYLPHTFQRR